MNKLLGFVSICLMLSAITTRVHAVEVAVAGASAQQTIVIVESDSRVEQLKAYLTAMRSPMVTSANHFVSEADRLNLDWKLVAAIAGVESTFGQHIPRNSYNGWGWGIYAGTSDGKHFASWNDGITQVSEGLRKNYIDKGAKTIDQMGRRYAASPLWSSKVKYFINKIESHSPNHSTQLAVTI